MITQHSVSHLMLREPRKQLAQGEALKDFGAEVLYFGHRFAFWVASFCQISFGDVRLVSRRYQARLG